jgi:hypothetical protein
MSVLQCDGFVPWVSSLISSRQCEIISSEISSSCFFLLLGRGDLIARVEEKSTKCTVVLEYGIILHICNVFGDVCDQR